MLDIGLNLILQPQFGILICADCKTSLGSSAIYHHACVKHSISLTDARISEWISTLNPPPLDTKALHLLAVTHSTWIPELPVQPGYECQACGKCLTGRDKIRTHCNKHNPCASWAETTVQTLVEIGNRRSYYKVVPAKPSLPTDNTTNAIETFFSQQLLNIVKNTPTTSSEGQDINTIHIAVEHVNKAERWLNRTQYACNFPAVLLTARRRLLDPPTKGFEELIDKLSISLIESNWISIIFHAAVEQIPKTPVFALRELASAREHDINSVPFSLPQQTSMQKRYFAYWTKFLVFLRNSVAENIAWGIDDDTTTMLEGLLTLNTTTPIDQAYAIIMDTSYAILSTYHELNSGSPFYTFLACISYDFNRNCWDDAQNCSSRFAGILCCARLIVFAKAWRVPNPCSSKDFVSAFRQYRPILLENSPYQIGEVLSLIAYALAKSMDKLPDVIWGPTMEYFNYHGDRFTIAGFKELVGHLIQDATALVDDLCFSAHRNPFGTTSGYEFLLAIKENPRNPTNNYCFLNDPRNTQLSILPTHCLSTIRDTQVLCNVWLAQIQNTSATINFSVDQAKSYLNKAERLLESCSRARNNGPPDLQYLKQATKHSHCRWSSLNPDPVAPTPRSHPASLTGSSLTIVIQIHKDHNENRPGKTNHKISPRQFVRPFAILLDNKLKGKTNTSTSDHSLFPYSELKKPGLPQYKWTTERLSALLDEIFRAQMGMKMNISIYQQCSKAITRELIERPMKHSDVFAKQAAHSEKVAQQHYGLNAQDLTDCPSHRMWEFLVASLYWHRFLDLPERESHLISAHNFETSPDIPVAVNPAKRIYAQISGGPTDITYATKLLHSDDKQTFGMHTTHTISTIRALQQLHGNQARFRSPEQSLAVSRVIARDSPLLVVLSTGGGKTDTWLIPLLAPSARLTLVVSPLVALAEDIVARSRELHINVFYCREEPSQPDGPPFNRGVIVTTTEGAITNSFFTFLCQ
ncbi:hypothetical protein L211DRAFT_854420 [Terfezia boudieri ATCC MYA-4762]|uniref:C2H2-type domain-containing protein n=1 Tax=Terfezia boudieri ATCC MYA-4762 TaxID=1051890 RepID=A0A3N4L5H5_9PEZI|nr:hypothetical protein L211DRAFT_854420 [Terfezia boudieri ATCC MYA-4762]